MGETVIEGRNTEYVLKAAEYINVTAAHHIGYCVRTIITIKSTFRTFNIHTHNTQNQSKSPFHN